MNGKKRLVAVALMLVVLAVPLLVQPVFAADQLPECYVQIVKEVNPPASDRDFNFTGAFDQPEASTGAFAIGHGEDWVWDAANYGTISVAEVVPEGWQEPEIQCTSNHGYSIITYLTAQVDIDTDSECDQVTCTFTNVEIPPAAAPPPFVPEASTFILLGSAATTLAGYVGLQIRARRRR